MSTSSTSPPGGTSAPVPSRDPREALLPAPMILGLPQLPPELLVQILEQVGAGGGGSDLRSATLVCRSWRPIATELIWDAVTLVSMAQVEAFNEASKRAGRTASSARSLSLVGEWGAGTLRGADTSRIVQRFSSLRSLELHCLDELPVAVFQLPQLAHLTSIHLSIVDIISRPPREAANPPLSTPLHLPFSLSSLTIGAITYDSSFVYQLFTSSPRLTHLSIRINNVHHLAAYYVEAFPLSAGSLRTLRLEILGPGRLPKTLLPLLRRCTALRTLELVDRGLQDLASVVDELPVGLTTLVLQPMVKELLLHHQTTLGKGIRAPGMGNLAVLRLVGLGRESREREGHAKELRDACERRGVRVEIYSL